MAGTRALYTHESRPSWARSCWYYLTPRLLTDNPASTAKASTHASRWATGYLAHLGGLSEMNAAERSRPFIDGAGSVRHSRDRADSRRCQHAGPAARLFAPDRTHCCCGALGPLPVCSFQTPSGRVSLGTLLLLLWLAGAKEPLGQLLVRGDYVPILAEALTLEATAALGVHQAVAGNTEHLTIAYGVDAACLHRQQVVILCPVACDLCRAPPTEV